MVHVVVEYPLTPSRCVFEAPFLNWVSFNGELISEHFFFRWSSDEPTVLEDINLTVKKGSLTAIVGTVGSGKSSLVSALLGEMEKSSGKVKFKIQLFKGAQRVLALCEFH